MKKLLSLLTLLLICILSMAQGNKESNKGFAFQGYARGSDGAALQNESDLTFKFTLYVEKENDPEFTEEQTLDTDEFGVFQATVGSVNTEKFKKLDFASYDYIIKVEVKNNGVYLEVAKKTLLAVPFAHAAEKIVKGGNGVPAGCIIPFAGEANDTKNVIPAGWFLCDGKELECDEYPELYAAIGTAWGGSGTSFNLPDLRGMFLRGLDNGRGWDDDYDTREAKYGGNSGGQVGSYQSDTIQAHSHTGNTDSDGSHRHRIDGCYGSPYDPGLGSLLCDTVLSSEYANDAYNDAHLSYVYTYYGKTYGDENEFTHSHTFTTDGFQIPTGETDTTYYYKEGLSYWRSVSYKEYVIYNNKIENGEFYYETKYEVEYYYKDVSYKETRPENMAVNYIIKY